MTALSVVMPAHNAAATLPAVLAALATQSLDDAFEVVVVDDGSTDDTAAIARAAGARCVVHECSRGRSAARNAGAAVAAGDTLLFIDSDCVPLAPTFLRTYLAALRSRRPAIGVGAVTALGDEFWARYQRDVQVRRARIAAHSPIATFSSQNFALPAALFRAAGGFDEGYARYGFEDRDLLARLLRLGAEVVPVPDALVEHRDVLHASRVFAKMGEAGGESAARFAAREPQVYRSFTYSRLDTRLHPWLRLLAAPARLLLALATPLHSRIDRGALPYPLAAACVRMLTALAFLEGTTRG